MTKTARATGRGNTTADREERPEVGEGLAGLATEWRPHDYQARLLAIDRGLIFASGGLGSGKSEPGALKLLMWALRYPRRADGRPTRWYAIGPDLPRLKVEQFPKILEHARRLAGPSVVRRVVWAQDPCITLCHGQEIFGRGATDPDSLRGYEVDGFWGDECQEWPEKTFRMAMSRMRSAAEIRAVLTASPEDSPGWNWQILSGKNAYYDHMRERLRAGGSGFYVFRWKSSQNRANKGLVLGVIGDIMGASGSNVAKQELEGRYPGTHEAPTEAGEIDFARAFVDEVTVPARTRAASVGLDIGESKDFAWLTALSADGVVLAMIRWNVSSPGVPSGRDGYYPHLENRTLKFVRFWGATVLVGDQAKAGRGILPHLARELGAECQVIAYDTSIRGKKPALIEACGTAMSRGAIKVPQRVREEGAVDVRPVEWVDYLKKEFEGLKVMDTGPGKRSFDHPPGGHDDGVVSLSLAHHGLAAPKEAPMIQRAWLQTFKVGEVDGRKLTRFLVAVLPPADDPTKDLTVLAALGADPVARRLYLLDVDRGPLAAHEVAPRLAKLAGRWTTGFAFVGRSDLATAGALQVGAALPASPVALAGAAVGVAVEEIQVDPDVRARAQPLAVALQAGARGPERALLFFLGGAWLPDLELELLSFPGGPHTAQVDALALGVAVFAQLVAESVPARRG